jgi:hypothetical protein
MRFRRDPQINTCADVHAVRMLFAIHIGDPIQLIGPHRGKTNNVLLNDIFVCLLRDTIAKTGVTLVI